LDLDDVDDELKTLDLVASSRNGFPADEQQALSDGRRRCDRLALVLLGTCCAAADAAADDAARPRLYDPRRVPVGALPVHSTRGAVM